jgi:hypothetical protein
MLIEINDASVNDSCESLIRGYKTFGIINSPELYFFTLFQQVYDKIGEIDSKICSEEQLIKALILIRKHWRTIYCQFERLFCVLMQFRIALVFR